MSGTLYVIATPIGNLEDITLRAIRILKEETDIVYCEDTRQTAKLLNHYGIRVPMRSLHTHSSKAQLDKVLQELLSGKSISYCTDSGTPAISDPGWQLVALARDNGIRIVPVPGPSAVTALLSVCGFPCSQFYFAGFLSKKDGKRTRQLQELSALDAIIVMYESPYRVTKLLHSIAQIMPNAHILIGREMTKHFEEFIYCKSDEIENVNLTLQQKGEFVIAVYNQNYCQKK